LASFTITAASQKVGLDSSGTASAAFTVTNTSGSAIKGRLIVTPNDPAKPEWLSLQGEPLRDFAPSAAEQVTVALKLPPAAPPGDYSFRLDAVAEDNPDEDFTEGPSVAFTVAAPAPKKKPFPWWIIVVAVVVLIGIGVVIWLLAKGSDKPKTPNMTLPTASGMVFPAIPATIPVQWDSVGPDASYRVEVESCHGGCNTSHQPVSSSTVTGTSFGFTYNTTDPGRVRVIAVVKGKDSDPGDWRSLTFVPPGKTGTIPPIEWCIPCLKELATTQPTKIPPDVANTLEKRFNVKVGAG
jgi:hypothetical protein